MSEPRPLRPGDPAPWFVAPATGNPRYNFDTAAGRFIVLSFFGSAAMPAMRAMLDSLWQRRDLFQDDHAAFFGVSCDPDDQRLGRVAEQLSGFRVFWDFGLRISKAYGACDAAAGVGKVDYRPMTSCSIPT
ncbi:MAG: redoxin domain-containing protein, partial [Dongiaceae bacterium]